MLLETQSFEFGDFLLDTREKVLLRGGKPVSITPKAFQLLLELVKNHGHLMAKDELMKTVWANSFVEEGNLAFTIRMLRKALDDTAQNPRFIETVTKRGYRFIGAVRRIEAEEKAAPENFNEPNFAATQTPNKRQLNVSAVENGFAAVRRQSETITKTTGENDSETFLHFVSPLPRSLFGRENEIAAVENLLQREDVRLITLTGIGGSGKTSLARVIAANRLTDFSDGVFFVELAPIFNPDLVISSIAETLDIKESSGNSLLDSLQNFLRERRILLVLDNFEQIISAATLLEKLLSATRQLKILVTSRAALRLNAENELVVPPLAVPPTDLSGAKITNPETYPSVQMFVERAQSVRLNFVLSKDNVFDIAQICARLDGLPLAIELAAARIKLLTPSAILQRLENRLQILTSRTDDLPERQQTMRGTIAWSFDLLGDEEKKLFKKLAIFAGGFTIEAAEKICGAEETNDAEILDGLESLVANNLLRHSDENGSESRLFMLETIREYAAELLAETAEEATALHGRHAKFFLDYARQTERDLMGARQIELLNAMEAERDNFRAAMDWWRKTNGENELKLTAALTPLWNFRGSLSEGIERLSAVIERNPNAAPAARAKALSSLGLLIWVSSDYVKAIEVCEKSLSLFNQNIPPIIKAQTLFVLGMSHWYRFGDAEKSIGYLMESLDLYREVKFDSGVVFTTVVLAAIYQTKNDLPKAAKLLDESMSAAERSGNNLARSIALVNYGRLKFAEGDFARAKEICQESLRLREELADRWGLVQCLEPLTAIAVIEGAPQHAAKMLGAIDVLLETLGAQPPLIFRADHEPSAAAVRATLDEKTFNRLFDEGRKLSIKESVALALAEPLDFSPNLELPESETPTANPENFKSVSAPQSFMLSGAKPPINKTYLLFAAVLVIGILTTGIWYFFSRNTVNNFPILSAAFFSENLSTNGKVRHAVISPDGKNVFYTNQSGGKMSVWLRQLESGNNVEIIPSSDDIYAGLALSPDGNFLYLIRRPRGFKGQPDIYRVSIFGGVPQKIISETQGWMSVSPDGGKISFVRCYYREDENCSLWIADSADGKNEKMLASRPRPFRIADNKISPDGKKVAFAAGQSENAANEFALMEVDITGGAEREITPEKFFNIKALAWLPDKSGLLITAARIPNKHFRIWQVSAASGNAEMLTKDSETYSELSLDKEAKLLIATQIKEDYHLRLIETENPLGGRVLANASTASFTPDGKIVFSSPMSGNNEIWIINKDGSGQKQLTNNTGSNSKPIVSFDNNSIFFSSNRTGKVQIWRMKADGSNQTQVTKSEGGFPIFASPDGRWVYYHHGFGRTLWRVSLENGEEQTVYDKPKSRFAISPDGLQFAFMDKQGSETFIVIASTDDKKIIKTIKWKDSKSQLFDLLWMPDGKNLAYISADSENENNILWINSFDNPTPKKIADLGDAEISESSGFAVSPDGKYFTVTQGGWLHDAVLLKGLK